MVLPYLCARYSLGLHASAFRLAEKRLRDHPGDAPMSLVSAVVCEDAYGPQRPQDTKTDIPFGLIPFSVDSEPILFGQVL